MPHEFPSVSEGGAAPRLSMLAGRRASAPPEPKDGDGGRLELHPAEALKILYKRRWTALTAFLLVFVGTTIQTFTTTPIYEARTRLMIESDERNVVSFKQVVEEDQTNQDYYQTQYSIMQSRALARRTLDSLKAWDTPPFGGPAEKTFSLTATVLGAPGALWRMIRPPQNIAPPAPDETQSQSQAIDAFLGGLQVAPVRNSRLVDLRYRSPNPELATTLVNALAKNYIEQNLEYKFLASKEASDWLGQRLGEQRKIVEAAEVELQQYREQNDAIAVEDRQNIVVQKLADLNAAVTRAKTERINKEATYNQLREAQTTPALLDSFPAILSNSFIQQQKAGLATLNTELAQLSEKLGDRHPQITALQNSIRTAQAKLQAEIAKIVQSVRSEYQAALAQENSLTMALNQQKAEALSLNRKSIEYTALQRDAQSGKQMYESLLQRAKETGVAGELKTSNIRVVDMAERPRSPVMPQKRLNLMFGFLSGILAGCILAFFFEYMDSRIKTPDEITTHLGIPFLGLLPSVPSQNNGSAQLYPTLITPIPATFSEAVRFLRTNVLFSSAEEGAKSVVVTSTGPGEGKSTVAANLAIAFAQTGQRVILLDADMRKPSVHSIFGTSQEPGMSNLLVGNVKASEAVKKSSIPGLWLLMAGRTPPNPAELVGSQQFRDLTTSLKEHFDWVIIDSPPVMPVTDTSLIAHHTSGVLFVIGSEMTNRNAAGRAVTQLQQSHARMLGAVLNRVDLHRNSYYYSQYYRREYTRYYVPSA